MLPAGRAAGAGTVLPVGWGGEWVDELGRGLAAVQVEGRTDGVGMPAAGWVAPQSGPGRAPAPPSVCGRC